MIRWGKETYEAVEVRIELRRKKERKSIAALRVETKEHIALLKRVIKSLERRIE